MCWAVPTLTLTSLAISAFPAGEIAGGGAQAIGLGAEGAEGRERLVDGLGQAGAGAIEAELGDEGLLAVGGVLAGGLAHGFGRGGDVEDVVGKLEGTTGGF